MKLVVRAFRKLIKTVESETRIARNAINRLRVSLFAPSQLMTVSFPTLSSVSLPGNSGADTMDRWTIGIRARRAPGQRALPGHDDVRHRGRRHRSRAQAHPAGGLIG